MRSYLNDGGLYATHAGDLITAQQYLAMSIRSAKDEGALGSLPVHLRLLSQCQAHLGETNAAWEAASEALLRAEESDDPRQLPWAQVWLAWLAALTGATAEAEEQFAAADRGGWYAREGYHMAGMFGIWWAEWLAHTERPGPALALAQRSADLSQTSGGGSDAALCDRMLGRLTLAAGDTRTAGDYLTQAAECFRDGDDMLELAATLADLASYALASEDLDAAERHAAEAIAIAASRRLMPAYSGALAAQARNLAARALATASPNPLLRGRDSADAAERIARRHQFAWQELTALRAHAALDQVEGTDRGWAAKANALRARLIPPGLDPDPLATVERSTSPRWRYSWAPD
jgi:hypothetical protein